MPPDISSLMTTSNLFTENHYLIRTKFFRLFGGAYHIFNTAGEVIAYSRMKAFKLKEDIRLYRDESMAEELLTIRARHIIDFSAGYDVFDGPTGHKIGTLRRHGFTALVRDKWTILDAGDQPIGTIEEDSLAKALLRRFVEAAAVLLPQRYHAEIGGTLAARFSQRFNPFIFKLDVLFEPGGNALDRRMGLAAGLLLSAIEGRQN